MKKQIAVMMCAISFDNQRKILEGIMAAAKAKNSDVFVFTNHVSYNEKELNKQGAFKIMELPEFELFDGVILAGNTIQYKAAAETLIDRILKSGIPAVSIDDEIEGMGYVGISNREAQKRIVEHIIHDHQKKNIAYVTGQLSARSGKERYQAYQDAMTEAGFKVDEALVFCGTYDVESGRNAVHFFVKQCEKMPEAIVCANDNMAIGVLDQLSLYGYRVPEDILVTGFDKDEMAEFHSPAITTVDAEQYSCGYKAVEMLFSDNWKDKFSVETKVCIGGSCGCKKDDVHLEWLRESYVKMMQIVHQAADSVKNMITEFAGLEQEQELMEALKKYVLQSDMERFYLCRCNHDNFNIETKNMKDQLDISETHTEYTSKMKVALACEHGRFVTYDEFETGKIIPEGARQETGGNLFVVTPIFYQNYCYGYCVSENSYFPLKSELFFSWVLNIGIGLENIRKWCMLNETVKQLNSMWVYDMLTHAYNRAGFFHYATTLLKTLQEENSLAVLLFVDIDGLKSVNDNLSHHMGDIFIKEIAECIKENQQNDQILMRYGGDEFVLFGRIAGEKELEVLLENIKSSMKKRNMSNQYVFSLGASIGHTMYKATEIRDLNEIIGLADQKMYLEKKNKKEKQRRI